MTETVQDWGAQPSRGVIPCRCARCDEVWWVRSASGGASDREFWPRFCCYCGLRFISTVIHDDDGSETRCTMGGEPI